MSVNNEYRKLPPPAPHKPLDVATMSIAAKRSSNLLSYSSAPLLANFTQHGNNAHPQNSYDTASATSQELKLLSLLSMATRCRPYNYLYGYFKVEKPSALTGWLELHIVPGTFWPEDNLNAGLFLSWEMKTGFTEVEATFAPTYVGDQLAIEQAPYTAFLATRRDNTNTGTIKLLTVGLQWVAL